MAGQLTDIDGIGAKTAETLKEQGITDPQELAEAYRDGELTGENSRVVSGARREAVDRFGSVEDPETKVRVDSETLSTFEMVDSRDVTSMRNAEKVTRHNSRLQDASVAGLAGIAARGELLDEVGPVKEYEDIGFTAGRGERESVSSKSENRRDLGRRTVFEMGLDTASSLTEFERETVERANEVVDDITDRHGDTFETGLTYTEVPDSGVFEGEEREREFSASARDTAAAKQIHRGRSPRAKRVDGRRNAPITTDLNEWVEDPSHHDFPGVDTKKRGSALSSAFGVEPGGTEIQADVPLKPDGNFRVKESDREESKGSLAEAAGGILSEPTDVQKAVIGDRLPEPDEVDFDLNPKGPIKELFK
jgi:hypothetical protein